MAQSDLEGRIYREVARIAGEQREEIDLRYPRIMRRVSGYNLDLMVGDGPVDLTRLVVGSEGTLCTVTEAKLSLEPIPKLRALAVLHFHGLIEAMEATVAILDHGPSAVELMGRLMIEQAFASVGFARRMTFVEGDPEALLLTEFFGDSQEELRAKIDRLERNLNKRGLG